MNMTPPLPRDGVSAKVAAGRMPGETKVEIIEETSVQSVETIDLPVAAGKPGRKPGRIRTLGVRAVSWTRTRLVWTSESPPLTEAEILKEHRLPALTIGWLVAPPIAALVILMAGPATDWTSLLYIFLAGLAALFAIRAVVPYSIRWVRAQRRRSAPHQPPVEKPSEGSL